MSQRVIFGGPSEIYEDGYDYHPSLVQIGYGEHAAHNEDYNAYAGLGGGVAFAQEMPEEAQRVLTYNALEDMREAWERDGVGARRQAGAMGSLWVEGALRGRNDDEDEDEGEYDDEVDEVDEADVRRGHQIFLGSSLRQRHRGVTDVALEESLWDDLAEENELPDHRRGYQCAEPALFSEHRYANSWDNDNEDEEDGGRVFVMDRDGEHLAPDGDDEEYGCRDICEGAAAYDLEDDE
ncbi:hypothetical protein VE04_04044 [Pseudogymnoascus sp. 24MN13]|nr:hypothetical protein VE04_04044 [Pseudogymnoascus sp. 24MN13]